ncbi:hypothetical protein GGX14DRAFT_481156, partial [Mycena pura]
MEGRKHRDVGKSTSSRLAYDILLFRISGDNLAVHSSIFQPLSIAHLVPCPLCSTSYEPQVRRQDLRGRALGHLSEGPPTSLSDFLSPRNLKSSSWANPSGKYNIAIILSAEWMIPVTLYRLCQHMNETEILDGINVQGRTVRLDRRDQIFALKAVTFLRGDARSEMLEFLCTPFEIYNTPQISGCRNGAICSFSRLQMHAIADGWRRTDRGHHMPFTIWTSDDFDDFGKKVKIVCSMCLAAMKKAHMRALQQLWDQLPGFCGLSGWTDLRQKKLEAVNPIKAKMLASL